MEENNLEPLGQGQSQEVGEEISPATEIDTAKTKEEVGAPSPLETVSLLGREYDLSKPDQVRELAKDYDRLGRQYAPLTQQLAQLEQMLESKKSQPQPNLADPEVEYISKLGFPYYDEKGELVYRNRKTGELVYPNRQLMEEEMQKKEDNMLEGNIQELTKTYDGKDGRPKFDRSRVLEFCVQNGISNPEYGYKLMNYDALREYDLRQAKTAPVAPPSSGSGGGQREPQPKKRVFNPSGDGQVSLRDAMIETLEQGTPTLTA